MAGKAQISRKGKRTTVSTTLTRLKLTKALVLQQQGLLQEAKIICEDILKEHPDHFDCLHLMGLIALQGGDYLQAAKLFGKSVDIHPHNPSFFYHLGVALQELGELDGAMTGYDLATALKPDFTEAWYNWGNALQKRERFAEAVDCYDKALASRGDFAEAIYNRTEALKELKKQKEPTMTITAITEMYNALQLRIQYELHMQKIKEKLPEGRLEHYEFKVYSQNGEDGVITEIFNRIGTTNLSFVEFGVENGVECNTVFLLSQGWNGLWMDGSEKYCIQINETFNHYIQNKELHIRNAFITRDNINDLIKEYYTGEIDLLSIDLDRNDYDVWSHIECIMPRVVVAEYNSKFPPHVNWHVPYEADKVWDGTDYFGMTLLAASELGKRKGYVLVGTETTGANCFFVRKDIFDKARDKFNYPMSVKDLWNPARYYLFTAKRILPGNTSGCGHPTSGKFPLLLS